MGPVDGQSGTWGVTWYVEVDASTPEEAVAEARKFLAPKYRQNWEPTTVDEVHDDDR